MGVLNQTFLEKFFIYHHGLKSKMTANKLSYLTVLKETVGMDTSRAEPDESGPHIPFLYKKMILNRTFFVIFLVNWLKSGD